MSLSNLRVLLATQQRAVSNEQNRATLDLLIAHSSLLFLPLALFVFRVHADHAHHTLAVDDLALVTDLLY